MNFSAILLICYSLISTSRYSLAVYPNFEGGTLDHTGRWPQDDDESSIEFNDNRDHYQDHDNGYENDVGTSYNLGQYGRTNSFGQRNLSQPIDNRNRWTPSNGHHLQPGGISPDEAFKRASATNRKINNPQENRYRPQKQLNPVTAAGLPPDELARAYGHGALPSEQEAVYGGPDDVDWNELHDSDGTESFPPGVSSQSQANQRNGNWHMRLGGKGVRKKVSRNQWTDELDDKKTLSELGMGLGEKNLLKSGVRLQPVYVERQKPLPPSAQIRTAIGYTLASAAGKPHLDDEAQRHGLLTEQQILPPDKRTYKDIENGYGMQRNGRRRNSLTHPDDMESDDEQMIPGLRKQGRTGTFSNDAQSRQGPRQVRFESVQGGAGFEAGENDRNRQSSLSGKARPSFRSRNGEIEPSSGRLATRWQPKSISGGNFAPGKDAFGRKDQLRFTPSRDPSKGGSGHSSTRPEFGASIGDQTNTKDTRQFGRDNRATGLDDRNSATGEFTQNFDPTSGRRANGVTGFNDSTNTGQFDQENVAGRYGKADQFGLGQQGDPSNGRPTNASNGFNPQQTTSTTTSQAYGTSQSNAIPVQKQQQAQSKFDTQPQYQAGRTDAFGAQNGRTPGFSTSGVSNGTSSLRPDPRLAAQQQGNSRPTGDQRQTVPQPRPGQTEPRQQQGGVFGNVTNAALDPNTYTNAYSNLQQSAKDTTSRLGQKMQDTTSQFGRTANSTFQSAQTGARSQMDSAFRGGANALNTASSTVKNSVSGFGNTAANTVTGALGGLGNRFGGGGGAAGGFGGQSKTPQQKW